MRTKKPKIEYDNNIYIKETFVNDTEGYQYGNSEWYETFTDDKKELFRFFQKEYGKAGKIYQDTKDGRPPKQVGWVFSKRMQYEDTKDYYTRSVWVELSLTEPVEERTMLNITVPF